MKQIKRYGTIGPACSDPDTLARMFEKGMTGVRINLSHTTLPKAKEWLEHVREAHQRIAYGSKPEILIDLQGPELRIGELPTRVLKEGEMISFVLTHTERRGDKTDIPIPLLVQKELRKGQRVLLDDGKLALLVEKKEGKKVLCSVLRGGILKSGKSIALPETEAELATLTESDLANLAVAREYGVTGVMLPFVRGKEDLICLRRALEEANAGEIRIFAKLENRKGVEKLTEILPYCDEVVIARGDLGNDMPLWELPVMQAQIARQCRQEKKPFLVVTQMLASMERNAVPTRAEVSDIFRAVSEGASSVMLTGETAVGHYPVEAMEYLTNTVKKAQEYFCND